MKKEKTTTILNEGEKKNIPDTIDGIIGYLKNNKITEEIGEKIKKILSTFIKEADEEDLATAKNAIKKPQKTILGIIRNQSNIYKLYLTLSVMGLVDKVTGNENINKTNNIEMIKSDDPDKDPDLEQKSNNQENNKLAIRDIFKTDEATLDKDQEKQLEEEIEEFLNNIDLEYLKNINQKNSGIKIIIDSGTDPRNTKEWDIEKLEKHTEKINGELTNKERQEIIHEAEEAETETKENNSYLAYGRGKYIETKLKDKIEEEAKNGNKSCQYLIYLNKLGELEYKIEIHTTDENTTDENGKRIDPKNFPEYRFASVNFETGTEKTPEKPGEINYDIAFFDESGSFYSQFPKYLLKKIDTEYFNKKLTTINESEIDTILKETYKELITQEVKIVNNIKLSERKNNKEFEELIGKWKKIITEQDKIYPIFGEKSNEKEEIIFGLGVDNLRGDMKVGEKYQNHPTLNIINELQKVSKMDIYKQNERPFILINQGLEKIINELQIAKKNPENSNEFYKNLLSQEYIIIDYLGNEGPKLESPQEIIDFEKNIEKLKEITGSTIKIRFKYYNDENNEKVTIIEAEQMILVVKSKTKIMKDKIGQYPKGEIYFSIQELNAIIEGTNKQVREKFTNTKEEGKKEIEL